MPWSDTWVTLSTVEPGIGTILRSEWWFIKKKRFDIGRCLLHRHSSFSPLLGEEDYLTSPKNVCVGGYFRSSDRSFFYKSSFRSSNGNLPCKTLLFTSYPHDPDFKFQPRGRNEVLKHGRQVYIPTFPAPTTTNVLHFDMISLLIPDTACSPFWLAHVISMKRVRTFSTW